MHAKSSSFREYHSIQALRAIAALVVVAGHCVVYLGTQTGTVPRALGWIHGETGVDIFFVISGFVMMISSGKLLTKDRPASTFLWRRLLRIVPLYWILTLIKLVLITARPSLSTHAKPSHWNVISSFLFIPSVSAAGDIRPLIPMGWTLSFEMFFYALFAVALWWAKPKAGGKGRHLMAFLVPAICVAALLGAVRTEAWPAWTAVADPLVLEFLAGAALARLVLLGMSSRPWVAASSIGVGFAALGVLSPAMWGPMPSRVAVWGVPAVMIVYGAVSLEERLRKILPAWLLLLGNASYAIYLIQTFVLPVVHAAMDRWFRNMVHAAPVKAGWIMMAMSLPLVSAAGVAVHLLLERPMTDYLKKIAGAERISPVAR